jgi:GT2 family glycosyltransferase
MARGRPSPLVHAIILNWNRWTQTLACIDSLAGLDYRRHRALIVDNGSDDGSVEELRSRRPELKILETGSNFGYAGGNNAGLAHALEEGAELIWVLNNDTRVRRATLSELVAAIARDDRLGVVASRQVRAGTEEQLPSAYRLRGDLSTAIRLRDGVARGTRRVSADGRSSAELVRCEAQCSPADAFHEADMVEGPSLLFRAAALRDVGLFDDRYFHYYEDTDLMLRIRRAGWRMGLACRSSIEHDVGGSLFVATPQAQYYMRRNELLFRRKLFGEHPLRVILREPAMLRHSIGLKRALMLDLRPTVAYLLGLADAIRGRTGPRNLGPSYRLADRRRGRGRQRTRRPARNRMLQRAGR